MYVYVQCDVLTQTHITQENLIFSSSLLLTAVEWQNRPQVGLYPPLCNSPSRVPHHRPQSILHLLRQDLQRVRGHQGTRL